MPAAGILMTFRRKGTGGGRGCKGRQERMCRELILGIYAWLEFRLRPRTLLLVAICSLE